MSASREGGGGGPPGGVVWAGERYSPPSMMSPREPHWHSPASSKPPHLSPATRRPVEGVGWGRMAPWFDLWVCWMAASAADCEAR